MKNRTLFRIISYQITILLLFLFLTIGNEIIDIPHYLFNDDTTLYSQRLGEIIIELSIFAIVIILQIILFRRLYKRIRLLEGFIPICASCKKIRNTKEEWEHMEEYISSHSLVKFSHSVCPECAEKLYPNLQKPQNKT